MSVLVMSKKFGESPGKIIGVHDEYDRFCFDEACLFIMQNLEKGIEPNFGVFVKENVKSNYSSPSELYDDLLNKG